MHNFSIPVSEKYLCIYLFWSSMNFACGLTLIPSSLPLWIQLFQGLLYMNSLAPGLQSCDGLTKIKWGNLRWAVDRCSPCCSDEKGRSYQARTQSPSPVALRYSAVFCACHCGWSLQLLECQPLRIPPSPGILKLLSKLFSVHSTFPRTVC